MKVTQNNLIEALKKIKLDGKIQGETGQIYVIFEHENRQFPLFIRMLHEGELLQLLTFIPVNVKPETQVDLSRFLHIVNKELDMPGFCVDDTSGTVFYRLILPTFKKEMNEDIFEAYMNTSQVVCKSFSPVIEALAMGAMTLQEILQKADELKAQQKAPK